MLGMLETLYVMLQDNLKIQELIRKEWLMPLDLVRGQTTEVIEYIL
jgi:hypothetical protein